MRFCAATGCPEKVVSGRCPKHQHQANIRPGAHGKGYTRQWERFRLIDFPNLLLDQGIIPACGARLLPGPSPHSTCAKDGVVTTDRLELDHDPPLEPWERAIPARVCDPNRVAYLCRADHSRKTRSEQASRGGDRV